LELNYKVDRLMVNKYSNIGVAKFCNRTVKIDDGFMNHDDNLEWFGSGMVYSI